MLKKILLGAAAVSMLSTTAYANADSFYSKLSVGVKKFSNSKMEILGSTETTEFENDNNFAFSVLAGAGYYVLDNLAMGVSVEHVFKPKFKLNTTAMKVAKAALTDFIEANEANITTNIVGADGLAVTVANDGTVSAVAAVAADAPEAGRTFKGVITDVKLDSYDSKLTLDVTALNVLDLHFAPIQTDVMSVYMGGKLGIARVGGKMEKTAKITANETVYKARGVAIAEEAALTADNSSNTTTALEYNVTSKSNLKKKIEFTFGANLGAEVEVSEGMFIGAEIDYTYYGKTGKNKAATVSVTDKEGKAVKTEAGTGKNLAESAHFATVENTLSRGKVQAFGFSLHLRAQF